MRYILLILLTCPAFAQDADKQPGTPAKLSILDQVKPFTINNVYAYYGNNGMGEYNWYTGNGGFEYPRGSGKTAVYESGLLWAGYHMGRPTPKAGGSAYRHALQAGRITTPGTPVPAGVFSPNCQSDDPTLPKYRIYRIRRDVAPGIPFASVQASLEEEAGLISRDDPVTAQGLYDQYLLDWNEWPARGSTTDAQGLAPFNDVNRNGRYEPAVDIPGQPGADQTLYYVANDNNSAITQNLGGCPPLGLEFHRTIWGYRSPEFLSNAVFIRSILINKSGYPIDSFQCGMWTDPDLGDSGDDAAGCDTSIGLAYTYNGDSYDASYGSGCPAVGTLLLSGPAVPGLPGDSAIVGQGHRQGFRNLPPYAAAVLAQGNCLHCEPSESGDVRIFRLLRGLLATGTAVIDPNGVPARFHYPGDPLIHTGWLDPMYPGDRRLCLSTEPFSFGNGDTAECTYATVIGLGGDRLSSTAVLKTVSRKMRTTYPAILGRNLLPPEPPLRAVGDDRRVHLIWGESQSAADTIERFSTPYFSFQGYVIYQIDSLTGNEARVATLDIRDGITTVFDDVIDDQTGYIVSTPTHFGTDSGLRRSITVTTNSVTNSLLFNWKPTAFAVTAYSLSANPQASPRVIETEKRYVSVTPQPTPAGTRRGAAAGDTLRTLLHFTTSGPPGGGTVLPVVLDPNLLTGHIYRVQFRLAGGTLNWDLVDQTTGVIKTANQTDLSGSYASPIVDGIQFLLIDGPEGAKLSAADVFDISTPAGIPESPEALKTAAHDITVYPNPYISSNPDETNRHIRFVTIARLPQRATIRIFGLNGDLVRTFVKDDDQQIVRWDLLNEAQYTVGSGMYIIHITLPDAGVTKILKLAVIPRIDIPDRW